MKLVLDNEILTESFFDDTLLLGIMFPAKNYKFCWQLNLQSGYNFRLNTDIEIQLQKKGRTYFFPVYRHIQQNNALEHYIYHNHFDGEYLLPEFKHLDFLWLVKGDNIEDVSCSEMIKDIRTINGVQLVAELTNEKIKNKGNLVF
jgi:hypothetical protein